MPNVWCVLRMMTGLPFAPTQAFSSRPLGSRGLRGGGEVAQRVLGRRPGDRERAKRRTRKLVVMGAGRGRCRMSPLDATALDVVASAPTEFGGRGSRVKCLLM